MSVKLVRGEQSAVHISHKSAGLPSFKSAIASFKDRIYALDNGALARRVLEGLNRFNTQVVFDPADGMFTYFEGLDLPQELTKSLGLLDSYVRELILHPAMQNLKEKMQQFAREFGTHVQTTFQSYEDLFALAEQLEASGEKEQAVHALYIAAINVLGEVAEDKLTAAVAKIEEIDPNMVSLDLQQRVNLQSQKAFIQLSKRFSSLKNELDQTKTQLNETTWELKDSHQKLRAAEKRIEELNSGLGFLEEIYGFGPRNWMDYFGVGVGHVPPLPEGIEDVLEMPCPYWEGQKVKDTHMLVMIPAQTDDIKLDSRKRHEIVDKWLRLLEKPKRGRCLVGRLYVDPSLSEEILERFPWCKNEWVLMTKKVLPGSLEKLYKEQLRLLKETHRPPQVWEAMVAVVTHQLRTGKKLYIRSDSGFTRCDIERSQMGRNPHLLVGNSANSLVSIQSGLWGDHASKMEGLAAVWRVERTEKGTLKLVT